MQIADLYSLENGDKSQNGSHHQTTCESGHIGAKVTKLAGVFGPTTSRPRTSGSCTKSGKSSVCIITMIGVSVAGLGHRSSPIWSGKSPCCLQPNYSNTQLASSVFGHLMQLCGINLRLVSGKNGPNWLLNVDLWTWQH